MRETQIQPYQNPLSDPINQKLTIFFPGTHGRRFVTVQALVDRNICDFSALGEKKLTNASLRKIYFSFKDPLRLQVDSLIAIAGTQTRDRIVALMGERIYLALFSFMSLLVFVLVLFLHAHVLGASSFPGGWVPF